MINKNLKGNNVTLLGTDKNKNYYTTDGYKHVLLFAPAGSGKGVGFVIPNLLFWQESAIVHDIGLENHQLTSGWRASQGHNIFIWNPLSCETHRYNPLDWVSKHPDLMFEDIQKMAYLLIAEKDAQNNEAKNLFIGIMLYLMSDSKKKKSFGEVVRFLMKDFMKELSAELKKNKIHPTGAMFIKAFLNKREKERSKIISILVSYLEPWTNPLIDNATSTSDFNIMDFKKKKITLYVGLDKNNITRLQPVMRFFYQHVANILTSEAFNEKKESHGVLFLMDEFPSLGKMDVFLNGMSYFRGYHVKLLLLTQNIQQLKNTYGEYGTNAIISNSSFKILFAANNYETAQALSQLCIDKTKKRELFSWQQFLSLPRDEQIILEEYEQPILSKKIVYFKDPEFNKKIMKPYEK